MVSELQAEFIERFPQFIEWPADSSVGDATVPFTIGVFGDTEVLGVLQRKAARLRIKGKPVQTIRIRNLNELGQCQIIFVAYSKRSQLSEVLGEARSKPILTISDTEGFGQRGVMINFTVEGESLRFEINEGAASAVGLRMAPKLLALGKPI